MTLLGVDYGRRRFGLAVKPAGQDWALPREVLHVTDPSTAVDGLQRALAETGAEAIVIGLPEHDDPTMAVEVRRFCRRARRRITGVRWFFVDETLTSQAAEAISIGGGRGRPSDDLAAKLILESFLLTCPEDR